MGRTAMTGIEPVHRLSESKIRQAHRFNGYFSFLCAFLWLVACQYSGFLQ